MIESIVIKLAHKYEIIGDFEMYFHSIFSNNICLSLEPCFPVLKFFIETADYPKNLISILMLKNIMQQMEPQVCIQLFAEIFDTLCFAWVNYTYKKFRDYITMSIMILTEKIEFPILIGKSLHSNNLNLASFH